MRLPSSDPEPAIQPELAIFQFSIFNFLTFARQIIQQ